MNKFDEFISRMKAIVESMQAERATAVGNLYDMLFKALDAKFSGMDVYARLIDMFRESDGSLSVVIAVEGQLYQMPITFDSSGNLSLGQETLVEYDFKPAERKIVIRQQADGKTRWFLFPAATAVLNRSGELDSRKLFDSFIEHAEKTGEYPFLTIYHQDKPLEIGQADFMGRDGFSLIMSGLFNDRPLSKAVAKTLSGDTEGKWGDSIGFYYDGSMVERIEVADGIMVNVYNHGICREASILLEKDAASLFTGATVISTEKEKENMKPELRKKIDELVGADPEAKAELDALEAKLDTVNQSIEGQNLVRREVPPVEPPAPTPTPAPEPAVFELTDEAIAVIAERIASSEAFTKVNQSLTDVTQLLETERASNAELKASFTKLDERVKVLESDDKAKLEQAIADMPRRNVLTITERPRNRGKDEQETDGEEVRVTLADIAAETLAGSPMK